MLIRTGGGAILTIQVDTLGWRINVLLLLLLLLLMMICRNGFSQSWLMLSRVNIDSYRRRGYSYNPGWYARLAYERVAVAAAAAVAAADLSKGFLAILIDAKPRECWFDSYRRRGYSYDPGWYARLAYECAAAAAAAASDNDDLSILWCANPSERAAAAVDSVDRAILSIQFFAVLLLICRKGYSRDPDVVERTSQLLLTDQCLVFVLLMKFVEFVAQSKTASCFTVGGMKWSNALCPVFFLLTLNNRWQYAFFWLKIRFDTYISMNMIEMGCLKI